MAEQSRTGGGESSSPETGIPTGLNRIKTRRLESKERPSSRLVVDSDKLNESPRSGASTPRLKQDQRAAAKGRKGHRKGRKIASWFASYIFKDLDQAGSGISVNQGTDKQGPGRNVHKMGKHVTMRQSSQGAMPNSKASKTFKSFSHELGPKGGIQPSPPRAHSYNDLKELIGSLRLRFDAAKEAVNTELGGFLQEVVEIVQKNEKNDSLPLDGQKMAGELVVLAQDCIKMTCLEFRSKCEAIVQDLTMKRQECQMGLLKWLLTRMLFILTRCTRLLYFAKDSEPVDETSLAKLKECLNRIPSIKTDWVLKRGISDSEAGCTLNTKAAGKCSSEEEKTSKFSSHTHQQKSEFLLDGSVTTLEKDPMFIEPTSSFINHPDIQSNMKSLNHISDRISGELKNECRQQYSDDSLVICRICEELVPTIHLEPHSYICAYAEKCDSKSLDVDERLLKFAELLDQLVESRNLGFHATSEIQENSKVKNANSGNTSEGYSPNMGEWRSKGIDGMFEDLHEMDTASIEDSPLAAFVNLKSHLGAKFNHCGPPSSTGSMTSVSSTNTPRAVNFDFWLEHSNLSELEDVQQMADLADIARCAAGTDLSEEGSHELLIAFMQDLQYTLQNNKLKALVVDTFGGRIENLLREKYILACDLVGRKDGFGNSEGSKILVDNSSHSSIMSTPSSSSHKERTSIDDFEIIKPISRGAFGRVFLARKRSTGDLFAIKVLKKLDLLRKNDIERILAERNILITVRNPFVVRFFYSFTSRDYLYLVMEYLNGGDLFSLLKKVGCLEEDVARTYVAELVLALEYLHSLGIVHRDLKPDNILIAQDGHIKLTDFGLSKIGLMNSTDDLSGPDTKDVVLPDVPDHLLDKSQRSAVGTPDYLAPEILLGTEHGSAADWWSVGIILFELITGFPPFNAEHPEVIFDNILNKQIPWPFVPEEMSLEAQDLIDRLLVHDPNLRLGAKGASEVKAHQFFRGVDWDNLALQKAAFVPQTDGVDDTSYFVSRYGLSGVQDGEDCNDSASDSSEFSSNFALENMDECGDLAQFDPSPLDLSLMNFSFKNLSQLASINHDMLLQSGFDSSRCSSPCKGTSE
ncbi:putative serine/threonine protein kinase IRE4 [Nicotiana tabacum]|uniref:non-specific serine/threonine protein kinase n=1 Tax=Nicotiana tabacum TaxID=4097 RepID=A0A1S3ZUD7_TOBAC|nr:PREDICTED: probable serine/threonine protein kinase IRE4 isoform X1 [Nicotiana tabacum]